MEEFINPSEYLEEQKKKMEAEREHEKRQVPGAARARRAPVPARERAARALGARHPRASSATRRYYFVPQMQTKIMNEGWASYWHSQA